MAKTKYTLEMMIARQGFEDDELLTYAEWLGFNSESELEGLKGIRLCKKVANKILSHPRQVLSHLPSEDLQFLEIMKDTDPGMGMRAYPTSHVMAMTMIGMAEEDEIEDDGMEMISISEDFKKVIRPHVDDVLEDFNVKFRLLVERIILGALNLYGALGVSELKKILKDYLDLTDDGSGVFDHIYNQSVLLKLQYVDGSAFDMEDYLVSPFVQDYGEYIIKERDKRKETTTLKGFDKDTIREVGCMPIPTIPNPFSDKLQDVLENKLGFTTKEAYYWEFMLWRVIQDDDTNPIKLFQMLLDAASKGNHFLKGTNEVNAVMQVVMNFLNHTPRWKFRGHCPDDLQKSINPGMAMPFAAHPKVGRNDPCPCGSGKKYKNCCGRGN